MAIWQQLRKPVLALVVAMSPVGYLMLESNEGLGQPGKPVQTAYADPYYGWKIATICYGHTAGVHKGSTATMEQCEQFLKVDVARHCGLVYDALLDKGIWLTQGEQDAYCSLAYNLGQFKDTASVYGRLLAQDDWGACMGLLKYHYSNGQPSRGLWNRRYDEYNLCISNLTINYKAPHGHRAK